MQVVEACGCGAAAVLQPAVVAMPLCWWAQQQWHLADSMPCLLLAAGASPPCSCCVAACCCVWSAAGSAKGPLPGVLGWVWPRLTAACRVKCVLFIGCQSVLVGGWASGLCPVVAVLAWGAVLWAAVAVWHSAAQPHMSLCLGLGSLCCHEGLASLQHWACAVQSTYAVLQ